MTLAITALDALEILDSRGNPTVRVLISLSDGSETWADVPSGASTGQFEAHELRDGDAKRFKGKGVGHAVANIRDIIRPALVGNDPTKQAEIDRLLIDLDGTPNKAKLGANATVGVSMAVARAAAQALHVPLYKYLGGTTARRIPVPQMNIINGGKHAGTKVEFQEFMIVPRGAPSFAEAYRYGAETYQSLKGILQKRGALYRRRRRRRVCPGARKQRAGLRIDRQRDPRSRLRAGQADRDRARSRCNFILRRRPLCRAEHGPRPQVERRSRRAICGLGV